MVAIMFASIIAGVLAWTFVEYVIHRWLGHDRRFTRRSAFGHEHVEHHAKINHFSQASLKLGFFILAAIAVVPLAVMGLGVAHGLAFSVALLGSYVVYEVIHRVMHVSGGVGPYGRMLRRHHFFHHFHDPKKNFGVSSPLWDIVFGTWVRPVRVGRIAVPRKLAMPWLFGADGVQRSRFVKDYELRG